MNVTTQAEQIAVFRNAAAHHRPGGRFVVEGGETHSELFRAALLVC